MKFYNVLMFQYICEFNLYFDKKNNKKNAVIPTYPIVFPKKNRRKIKSFSYLPTLFDFSMLAETNLFFFGLMEYKHELLNKFIIEPVLRRAG